MRILLIYIYIYIVIHRQICFVLSELISVSYICIYIYIYIKHYPYVCVNIFNKTH